MIFFSLLSKPSRDETEGKSDARERDPRSGCRGQRSPRAAAPAVISRYKIWLTRWEGCGVPHPPPRVQPRAVPSQP